MTLTPPEQVDPQSLAFANRASDLLAAQPWMDSQSAVTLAQQQTTNEQMHAQAQAMGDALAQSWNGYEQQFYDPILQAQPSAQQAATAHVFQTIGPPPATNGIVSLQAALKADGFLSADPTGVWDSETENAYNQAVNALKAQQYGGAPKKHGNPFTSTVSALYHAVINTAQHPWDAAIAWYDSTRQVIGDVGGLVATGSWDNPLAAANAAFGSTSGTNASVSARIYNDLGTGKTTAAQQEQAHQNPMTYLGDVLAAAGAASVVRGVAKGVIGQVAKSTAKNLEAKAAEGTLTDAEALKFEKLGAAMTTAQRMGFIQRSINDIGNAVRAGTLPASDALVKRNLGIVTKTLLRAPLKITGPAYAATGKDLISQTWRDAVPGLARLAPVAEKLAAGADEGGWAYKIRNVMAVPYKFPLVRAAGIATTRAQIAALGAHAAANLLPGSQLQQHMDNTHTGFDSWLDNATWNVLPGVKIGPEDLLLGPLHGDLTGAGRASQVIGATIHHWQQSAADGLGKLGVEAGFQSILGLSRQQLVDLAGSEGNLRLWINDKTNQYASDLYAQRQMASSFTHTFDGGTPAFEDASKAARDSWYGMDEAARKKWVADLATTDSHFVWLRNRLQSDVLRGAVDPKAAVRASMDEFFNNAREMQSLMDAGLGHYVLGPSSYHALAEMGSATAPEAVADAAGKLPSGAIGLQGVGVRTREEIRNEDLPALKSTYTKAADAFKAAAPEGKAAAWKTVQKALNAGIQYAHEQFNMDASRLQVFERNPEGLWNLIADRAGQRASKVLPTFDQPEWMAQRLKALEQRGYRVVIGSHIGHAYDRTLPNFTQLDGFYTPLRKWAGKVGLDPGRVPDAAVSDAIRANQDALVHNYLTTTPGAALTTPRADFRTVRAVMQDKNLARTLPLFASAFLGLTSRFGLNKTEIARIMERTGKTRAEARAEMEDAIAAQFGVRDLPRQQLIDNLTTTHEVAGPAGTFTWRGVDAKTANGIVDAYYKGYKLPGYMMGWEAIENWARASRGIGDKMIARHPDSTLIQKVNGWPNKLVQARNTLRFTASPVFAARVATKQRYKAALEGVRIPWDPLAALERQGATDKALEALTRLDGRVPHEQLNADRYLLARDVFGIHDSQWDGAYFVHTLQQQGKSPTEIKTAYERVFKYGAQGGRTGLERTANTIFFPFSFEKTLLRNTGAYLADRPGQALALDLGIEEWRNLDKNAVVGRWVTDHLPILREIQLMNAFAHGISPGQFGGINATLLNDVKGGSEALLNLFLPQAWGKNLTKPNLEKYMPIWGELKNLVADVNAQQAVAGAAVHDTLRSVLKHNWKPEPTLVPKAQISYALRTKAHLVNDPGVKSIIDYNSKQSSDADKYLWPQDKRLPDTIWGHPIDKTTIAQYVQYLYPAYDPNSGAAHAKNQAVALDSFIRKVGESDPAKGAQMKAFQQVADQVVSHLNRNDYDTPTAAAAQAQFQALAPKLNADPQWKALYNNFYAWALGPIQTPAQKAGAK